MGEKRGGGREEEKKEKEEKEKKQVQSKFSFFPWKRKQAYPKERESSQFLLNCITLISKFPLESIQNQGSKRGV